MKACFLSMFLFCFLVTTYQAQDNTITFNILEHDIEQPIEAAHVFLLNSTIGSISDAQGKCNLSWPNNFAGQLVVSHIAFENVILSIDELEIVDGSCVISLKANNSSFNEIVVTSKRDSKWKKHFNTFQNTFLGTGKEAEKCEILNPQVLRFDSNKERFKATATAPLKIRNDYLGYDIEYLLDELIVEADGSKSYKGQARFTDLYGEEIPRSISKKRNRLFLASRRHFFQTLINDSIHELPYEVTTNTYLNGHFIEQSKPSRNELLVFDEISGFYKFYFSDFLQVVNFNYKSYVEGESKKITGIESSRFNSTQTGGVTRMDFPISQLYKISPYLLLDPYGNIYNTSDVKEYGFWAELRMASMLPLNYKIENTQEVKALEKSNIDIDDFKKLVYGKQANQLSILTEIDESWTNEFYAPLLDLMRLVSDEWLLDKIHGILRDKSEGAIINYYDGLRWLWKKAYAYPSYYADLKAELYKYIDPKFETYFKDRGSSVEISLDEVMWGGVEQDGIPPLRTPKMLTVKEGNYLDNEDVVFGIYINGIAKAYPKRILAWHEFFVDDFKGDSIAGVYCTLCGTVIAYDMTFNGQIHQLGTSGFLYRSNKLMYDTKTQSLWNTIEGKPVIGPLVGKGIELKSYPVVTTTWAEWKAIHPETLVLSLDTGYSRNYNEGEAYKDYYSTDELMFPVPLLDNRLKNKAEVFIVKLENFRQDPIAISTEFLKKQKIYQDSIMGTKFVAIAEKGGVIKAYQIGGERFASYENGSLIDSLGNEWEVTEEQLISSSGKYLARIPSHNIFWFAWVNAFPSTRLVY